MYKLRVIHVCWKQACYFSWPTKISPQSSRKRSTSLFHPNHKLCARYVISRSLLYEEIPEYAWNDLKWSFIFVWLWYSAITFKIAADRFAAANMSTQRRFNPHVEGRNYPEFSRDDIEAFYDGFVGIGFIFESDKCRIWCWWKWNSWWTGIRQSTQVDGSILPC